MPFLPNLFILGAAKCGTTTLHEYLAAMPEICMSDPKEPFFFECEFHKGLDYYQTTCFAHWQGEAYVGDARHRNLYLPYVAERIHAVNPNALLIAIVRNPIDRAYAHWWHWYSRQADEERPFWDAIHEDHARIQAGKFIDNPQQIERYCQTLGVNGKGMYSTYLDSGYYAEQIERYLALFDRRQLHIIFLEDLMRNPLAVITGVQQFIGIQPYTGEAFNPIVSNEASILKRKKLPPVLAFLKRYIPVSQWVPTALKRSIRERKRPPMSAKARAWLQEHYLPHNQRLEKIVGRDLSHWV